MRSTILLAEICSQQKSALFSFTLQIKNENFNLIIIIVVGRLSAACVIIIHSLKDE